MASEILAATPFRMRPPSPSFSKDKRVPAGAEVDVGRQTVVLRGRTRRVTSASPPDVASTAEGRLFEPARGALNNTCNKRNATYLTQEEYDDDLAQLDLLLHYVNNLSASLEFLQWEKKRISTDLVPTLLNMYDALYARLSESPHNGDQSLDDAPLIRGNYGGDRDEINTQSPPKDPIQVGVTRELFIQEPESPPREPPRQTPSARTGSERINGDYPRPSLGSVFPPPLATGDPNEPGVPLVGDHDYDIPESIERRDSRASFAPALGHCVPEPHSLPSSNPMRSSREGPTPGERPSEGGVSVESRPTPYRPVSSISSSSASSSSSSNSLTRRTIGGLASSYLASVESLEDGLPFEGDISSSRRKDRSLKSRRAIRTGSGDSGVQCHIISLPAPPPAKPRYCDPDLDYLDRVVLEIVETEEVYVRDLREVIQGYLEHWRSNPEPGISPDTIESLFSNIEQIYTFNRCFLSELERCGSDPVAVAKCFVRNNSGFAIYTEYCTNYPRTVSLLTDLMREERSVRACRERQLCLGHTLPLGSYLLKPVQRVLKYHLLLGNIVKHFGKERPGNSHIWNALSAMTGLAHHINHMKRKHEHAVRVQEIQSLLYGWQGEDLTTFGELAAEGTFKVSGFKGPRHVFLFDKILLIAKRKDENILVYKAHIMCSDLMLIESIPGEPLSFHVIPFNNPKCQYTLECRNLDQKREWTLQLKRVILENYNVTIPAHARQLVMELGQAKNGDLSPSEWRSGGRKTHHAPEYLERRKDRRRASETGLNSRLKIRRSSRARKTKEEKENRSRSVSRTRETDEDDERKVPIATSSSADKSKLRLPMWRRRSEPGVHGRLRISSPEVPSEAPLVESGPGDFAPCDDPTTEVRDDEVPKPPGDDVEKESNVAPPSESEGDPLYDPIEGDDNEATDSENLEHIVSQLLQHQLQIQQIILNKQRRTLVRKKKIGTQYETSDTENEDSNFECRPPLPSSPPPPLSSCGPPHTPPFSFPLSGYRETPPVGRESSGTSSVYCSTHSVARKDMFSETPSGGSTKENTPSPSTYDNLGDVWGKWTPPKGQDTPPSGGVTPPGHARFGAKDSSKGTGSASSSLRRVHSFSSSSLLLGKEERKVNKLASLDPSILSSSKGSSTDADGGLDSRSNCSCTEGEAKERPATIAVYEASLSSHYEPLCVEGNSTAPPEGRWSSTTDPLSTPNPVPLAKYQGQSNFSVDDLITVHPDHKIYSKASVNKGSIKKVLSKLTGPKGVFATGLGSPTKTVSEPSYSLSNLYVSTEFDRASGNRRGSGLVSSMARQCSRTLKERIKQIRTEDLETPQKGSNASSPQFLVGLPSYKQGSPSMGARIAAAASTELSDYAVPVIRPTSAVSRTELRPDSVLSSSSIWTSSSSSSSSNREVMGVLEEATLDPLPRESDHSGDSFYEKSFEAIESFLDDEMFRDSAIYSEAEEGHEASTVRGGTLTPRHSFNYKHRSSFRVDYTSGDLPLSSSLVSPLKPDSIGVRKCSIAEEILVSGRTLSPPSGGGREESSPPSRDRGASMPASALSLVIPTLKKVPPPVPAKPDSTSVQKFRSKGTLIQQQLRHLEERINSDQSTEDKRRIACPTSPSSLPGYAKGSSSPSSSLTLSSRAFEEQVTPKGWVKHVVGRLQQ